MCAIAHAGHPRGIGVTSRERTGKVSVSRLVSRESRNEARRDEGRREIVFRRMLHGRASGRDFAPRSTWTPGRARRTRDIARSRPIRRKLIGGPPSRRTFVCGNSTILPWQTWPFRESFFGVGQGAGQRERNVDAVAKSGLITDVGARACRVSG